MSRSAISSGVASADPWTPSRRIRSAAAAERRRIERELVRLAAREDQLGHELAGIRESCEALEHELSVLHQLAPESATSFADAPPGRRLRLVDGGTDAAPSSDQTTLRGAKVRETAVRVLVATGEPDQALHYRTWFDLLRRRGFLPAGKDPLATFLTQISRSPVVRRSTEPGIYSLDLSFPTRAARQLDQLRSELGHAHELPDDASVADVARARERKAQLRAKTDALERSLDEARRSLLAD